jgi:hypothetical protein
LPIEHSRSPYLDLADRAASPIFVLHQPPIVLAGDQHSACAPSSAPPKNRNEDNPGITVVVRRLPSHYLCACTPLAIIINLFNFTNVPWSRLTSACASKFTLRFDSQAPLLIGHNLVPLAVDFHAFAHMQHNQSCASVVDRPVRVALLVQL